GLRGGGRPTGGRAPVVRGRGCSRLLGLLRADARAGPAGGAGPGLTRRSRGPPPHQLLPRFSASGRPPLNGLFGLVRRRSLNWSSAAVSEGRASVSVQLLAQLRRAGWFELTRPSPGRGPL